jgi:hypothetical protein
MIYQKLPYQSRIKFLKIFLAIFSVGGFIWWPLSHWCYPYWYHSFLGFDSVAIGYVRIIGTLSVIPVLLAFFCALDPERNRHGIIVLITGGILVTATYLYLIWSGLFPQGEYLNAVLTAALSIILGIMYPWRKK